VRGINQAIQRKAYLVFRDHSRHPALFKTGLAERKIISPVTAASAEARRILSLEPVINSTSAKARLLINIDIVKPIPQENQFRQDVSA
jgi:hypothetical protein